ncbi:MAG: F0F1 ATP synthase subunit B' [Robiginitomaculum sp.]|nr:F0F1 ATP synthase subunit B' [Robiginitomaculum sp.]
MIFFIAPNDDSGADIASKSTEAGFSPFDMTYASPHIFWLVISFGLLFFVLWKVILPRLASTIEERNDKIADDLDQATQMKADAEAAGRAYDTALADSKSKAHAIAASARAKMDVELSAEIEAAEAGFAERATTSEMQIREATDKALSSVEGLAVKATKDIVNKLGGVAPSDADIRQAVKSALA